MTRLSIWFGGSGVKHAAPAAGSHRASCLADDRVTLWYPGGRLTTPPWRQKRVRYSLEVQNILKSAQELALGAEQPLTTGHIMLGMLTSTSRAGRILEDLKVDPARLLDALGAVKRVERKLAESDDLLSLVEDRMHDAAHHSGASLVSSLHLLLALTREKAAVAYQAFSFMGIPPVEVRTAALGQITGPAPRTLRPKRPIDAAFAGEPSSSVGLQNPQLTRTATPKPPTKAKRRRTTPVPSGEDNPFLDADSGETPGADDGSGDDSARYRLDPEDFPILTSLGNNLSSDASKGLIDPVIGRSREIDTVIDVLNKRRSNNPCLVGEPGVGKTAIVEGLALALIEKGEHVAALADRIVIAIDVGALVAGTELRGSFSRRMAKLKEEVRASNGRVIVFIDEIHTLVGAGSGEGALDAANDLKAALARGEFPCIGATTPREFHRYIEKDPALERRFQAIEIEEPSEEDALTIVQGVLDKYEAHHGVLYQPEAVEAAVRLSRRYIVDRRLPDKAFNLIDTAAARAVRRGNEVVGIEEIAEVVTELTQIPTERLLMTDADRILGLRDFLAERIIGHDEVLDAVSEVIQRNSAGFSSKRPIGSFLFLGPSGVGKTETAKALAEFLFCEPEAMTRFDMSEFMERHAVSRLLGAAPGYVGYEEAGQLTAALKRRPYQLILFDEIEKAHPDALNLLLQVLDEGRLTDAKGQALNFANTVILMTSNLGSEVFSSGKSRGIGFGGPADGDGRMAPAQREAMERAAKKALPPEFWGRIDEKCLFAPLGESELASIARLMVAESSKQLEAERGIGYTVDDAVVTLLVARVGQDPTVGARPMRRAVQRLCETAIARSVLAGDVDRGARLRLSASGNELQVEPEPQPG